MVMPVTPFIGMSLSNQKSFGERPGTISAFSLSGNILPILFSLFQFHKYDL
jgi:hypothetical protein